MFSKTIKYTNLAGEDCIEQFYFHLGKAEIMELGLAHIQGRLERIKNTNDSGAILIEVRELVRMSAGVRSDDGKRFIKDEAAKSALFDSGAWDELLFELATDAESAAEFVNKLFPQKLLAEMSKHVVNDIATAPARRVMTAEARVLKDEVDDRPAWIRENREPTETEVRGMTQEQLREVYLIRVNR